MSSIRIRIDSFRKVLSDTNNSYITYKIDVWVGAQYSHSVERRYTEFENLNKKLSKLIRITNFPHKTVLKWSIKTLENRKNIFENYLTYALNQFPFGFPDELLKFLNYNQADLCQNAKKSESIGEILKAVYISEVKSCDCENIVSSVLGALYS